MLGSPVTAVDPSKFMAKTEGPSQGDADAVLDLATHYTALADDSQHGGKKREAALLFSIAEGHLQDDEDYDKAQQVGTDALAIFRSIGDRAAEADSLRVVIDAVRLRAARQEKKSDEAMHLATEGLTKFREEGDKRGEGSMLLSLAGISASKRGHKNREQGLRQAKESLALYREVGDKKMEAAALLSILDLHCHLRNYIEALGAGNKALAIFQDLEDRKGEARALHGLAVARFYNDQFEGAVRSSKDALAIFRELGLRKQEAFELHAMAQWHLERGNGREAVVAGKEALDILEAIDTGKGWQSMALSTLAAAYTSNKEEDAALRVVKQALANARETSNQKGEVTTLNILANTLLGTGDAEGALPRAEEALSAARDLRDRRGEATAWHTLAKIQLARKEYAEALRGVREAVPLLRGLDDLDEEGAVNHTAVNAHLAKEKHAEAMQAAKEARNLYQKAGNRNSEGRALMVICSIHRMLGDDAEAVSAASEAQFLFQKDRDRKWEAKSLHEIAEIHSAVQNFPAALRASQKALSVIKEVDDAETHAIILGTTATIMLSVLVNKTLAAPKHAVPEDILADTVKIVESARDFAMKIADGAKNELVRRLPIPMIYAIVQVHLLCRRAPEAQAALNEADKWCKKVGDEEGEVIGLVLAGYVSMLERSTTKAMEQAEKALALAQKIEYAWGEKVATHVKDLLDKQERGIQDEPRSQVAAPQPGNSEASAVAVPEVDPEMLKLKIQDVASSLMGVDEFSSDTPLMDAGLDSLSMVEFRNELVKEFPGVDMPGALLFDYPTINALTDFVAAGIRMSGKAFG